MFTVELYAKVRHAVMIEGLSRREAAKRFGIHRNTITKMLSFSVPPDIGGASGRRPGSLDLLWRGLTHHLHPPHATKALFSQMNLPDRL